MLGEWNMKYVLVGQREEKMDSLREYQTMDDMDAYTSSFKDEEELNREYPDYQKIEIIGWNDAGKSFYHYPIYYKDTRNDYIDILLGYITEEQKQMAEQYQAEHSTYQYTEYWLRNMSSSNFRNLVNIYDKKYHFSEQKSVEKNK